MWKRWQVVNLLVHMIVVIINRHVQGIIVEYFCLQEVLLLEFIIRSNIYTF